MLNINLDLNELKEFLETGASQREASKKFNVSQNVICNRAKKLGIVYSVNQGRPRKERPSCQHCYNPVKVKNRLFCSNACFNAVQKTKNQIKFELGEVVDPKILKRNLITLRGNNCELCSISNFWNGKELKLQLDHIDGNSDNNNPNNLRLLCPNCHSQTETFSCKGTGSTVRKNTKRNKYLQKYKQG